MKALILSFSLVSLAALSQAQMRIPSSVFTLEEIDDAMSEAVEEEEPLIFVVTNPNTN